MKFLSLFLVALLGFASQAKAEEVPRDLRKEAAKLVDLLMIDDPKDLAIQDIIIVRLPGNFTASSYTFFEIKFSGKSVKQLMDISPLLAHCTVRDIEFKNDLEDLEVKPKWPEIAPGKQEGLSLRWELERAKRNAELRPVIHASDMNLKCVFFKKDELLYGYITEGSLPTNGTFPDIVVDKSATVYSKSERREQADKGKSDVRSESKSEGSEKTEPESDGRSR